MRPEPINNIMNITPYKGGESKIAGFDKVHKLSSNENPLGFSKSALEAINKACLKLNAYPDGGHIELREAISARFGIDANRIICGNGSDEIFQILGRAYLKPGDEVIQSEYGFLAYSLVAQHQGAKCISAPTKDYVAQVDAIISCISEKTKMIFLDNPSNPTGTYLSFEEIQRLHKAVPSNAILVLDAAYAEYANNNDYSAGLELAAQFDNVVMTRTFSKIHGLAALRIGWGYGPQHIIDALNRVRDPFNLNSLAIAAGIAAMQDTEFVAKSNSHNKLWLDKISEEFTASGYKVIPSVANFILVEFVSENQANDFDEHLKANAIIARKVASYNLPKCLRISIGTEEANLLLIKAMKEFQK